MYTADVLDLLSKITRNTSIDIQTVKTTSTDWIEINAEDLHIFVSEHGSFSLSCENKPKVIDNNIEYWYIIKSWVRYYYQEHF